jgi:2-dehydropantoate 2-reductase
METFKKIAVYGAGAMGTVLGALLTKTGRDVTLVSRNKAHIDGLKSKGARIVCSAVNQEWVVPVNALTPDEMQEKYDLIFLMTKQRENRKIVEFLLPYLTENGIVCTTQNGFPERSVAEVLGKDKTYGAVLTWGANFVGEGGVELTSNPTAMRLQIGGYENSNEKTDELVELLTPVGELVGSKKFVNKTENLAGVRWGKLSLNAAFSGLSVVSGLTFGEICKNSKGLNLAIDIMIETIAVANACGVRVEKMSGYDLQKHLGSGKTWGRLQGFMFLPLAMKKHSKLVSGMLKDVQNGKKCEIDFIDGVVASVGKEYGVRTPRCDKVVEIVHGIENGLYEITPENFDFF